MAYKEALESLNNLLSNMALQSQKERINNRLREVQKKEAEEGRKYELALSQVDQLRSRYNSKLEDLNEAVDKSEQSRAAFDTLNDKFKTPGGLDIFKDITSYNLDQLNSEIKFLQTSIGQVENQSSALRKNILNLQQAEDLLESELLQDFPETGVALPQDIDAAFDVDDEDVSSFKTQLEEEGFANADELFSAAAARLKTESKLDALNKSTIAQSIRSNQSFSNINEAIKLTDEEIETYYDENFELAFTSDKIVGGLKLNNFGADSLDEVYKFYNLEENNDIDEGEFKDLFIEVVGTSKSYRDYISALDAVQDKTVRKALKEVFEEGSRPFVQNFSQIQMLQEQKTRLQDQLNQLSNAKAVSNNLNNNEPTNSNLSLGSVFD